MGGEWEVIEIYCGMGERNAVGVRESSWKCALTLRSYISVTDKVKINERNTSIATGPLYLLTEFDAI